MELVLNSIALGAWYFGVLKKDIRQFMGIVEAMLVSADGKNESITYLSTILPVLSLN